MTVPLGRGGGGLLDPCAHRAYVWVLYITQIQNARTFFSTELGSSWLLWMQDHPLSVGCLFVSLCTGNC